MAANLTINALLAEGAARLATAGSAKLLSTGSAQHAAAGSAACALDAELLLAHALGSKRVRLKSHPEEIPQESARERYSSFIERRSKGEPLAYIVGFRDFWTLRLAVSPAVLVPRPETELLVERALALRTESATRAVDLGTGSGAIALALASERRDWQVTATDFSPDALAIARANAASHSLTHVELLQGSWFEPLGERRFNLIVSNPPYIGSAEPEMQTPELLHEPRNALSPGEDSLTDLRTIVRGAPRHLEHGGWLLLEHGTTQAEAVARELVVRGFRHVRSHRDLAGHERMTEAQWGSL